jgi:hypothetical protein
MQLSYLQLLNRYTPTFDLVTNQIHLPVESIHICDAPPVLSEGEEEWDGPPPASDDDLGWVTDERWVVGKCTFDTDDHGSHSKTYRLHSSTGF